MEQMNLSKPNKDKEAFIKNVGEFHYELSVGGISTTWYAHYQDIYENRMAGLLNEVRINMLLRKFSKNDHDLYLAYLLPLSPKDFTYEETIESAERRFKCLNLAIREGEDIHKYVAIVNRMCNGIRPHPQSQPTNPKRNKPKCRFCGDLYFHRDCPFYKHRCQDCNSYGHKEGFCQRSQRRLYTDHRRGRLQDQNPQSHGVLTTMQVNISEYRSGYGSIAAYHPTSTLSIGKNVPGAVDYPSKLLKRAQEY
ncbi:unnamed protein product [Hymenolepis diminuta]|uniref:DUF7083 domain-containing protein n=1 Tax=Hymenolepis diminuta TaxID=6216 RepID=A0A564YU48_HYMDI|nr:unnamed protein product [Hymenolepis diminuta]